VFIIKTKLAHVAFITIIGLIAGVMAGNENVNTAIGVTIFTIILSCIAVELILRRADGTTRTMHVLFGIVAVSCIVFAGGYLATYGYLRATMAFVVFLIISFALVGAVLYLFGNKPILDDPLGVICKGDLPYGK